MHITFEQSALANRMRLDISLFCSHTLFCIFDLPIGEKGREIAAVDFCFGFVVWDRAEFLRLDCIVTIRVPTAQNCRVCSSQLYNLQGSGFLER